MTKSLIQLAPCFHGANRSAPRYGVNHPPYTSGHPQRFPTLVSSVKRTSEQPQDVMNPVSRLPYQGAEFRTRWWPHGLSSFQRGEIPTPSLTHHSIPVAVTLHYGESHRSHETSWRFMRIQRGPHRTLVTLELFMSPTGLRQRNTGGIAPPLARLLVDLATHLFPLSKAQAMASVVPFRAPHRRF